MIEIKDTRKTATKDPIVKMGDVVRINKEYYICVLLHSGNMDLFSLTDGTNFSELIIKDGSREYLFSPSELAENDIEVITNKITLTIE